MFLEAKISIIPFLEWFHDLVTSTHEEFLTDLMPLASTRVSFIYPRLPHGLLPTQGNDA